MRRKNKRRFILIFILLLIAAAAAGVIVLKKNNPELLNKATKKPIAYMEYMGSYMTFDKEGYVISSAKTPPESIPLVMGMEFEYVIVSEYLPIENEELFNLCIEISNALTDAELDINKIELSTEDEIFLYIGEVTVELGTKKNLENKLIHLKRIANSLKKYTAGVLDMSVYNEKGEYIFTKKN